MRLMRVVAVSYHHHPICKRGLPVIRYSLTILCMPSSQLVIALVVKQGQISGEEDDSHLSSKRQWALA